MESTDSHKYRYKISHSEREGLVLNTASELESKRSFTQLIKEYFYGIFQFWRVPFYILKKSI